MGTGKRHNNRNKKFRSINFRLPLIIVISSLLIMLAIIPTMYFRLKKDMMEDYDFLGHGITNFMKDEINADIVDEYIEKNVEMEEYNRIVEAFYRIRDNYPDVLYMYVYRYKKDGAHVVFDIDSEKGVMDADPAGTVCEIDPPSVPYLDDLCAGKQIPALIGVTKDGYLLSYLSPVFDSNGNYQCHVGVDFSMEKLRKQSLLLLGNILLIIYLIMLIVLLIDIFWVRKKIVKPITQMAKCTHKFSYTTANERMHNIQLMENLNINTGDEIEELYDDFLSVLKESVYYITNYGRAKLDIQDKEKKLGIMNEVAYKDSLTGAGNKAGWKKELELLYETINDNSAAFAIVMFDINNLKYVNDTFGHEQGDNYIINCSNMIRDIYSHSPMFRLGGDEFVVLLKGEDYADRNELLEIIKRSFINTYEQEDKKPYERYSASMGMAEYTESDNDPEQVLRRADEAMYCYKTEFKKKYGSYR